MKTKEERNLDELRAKIEKELNTINRQQIVHFAWLCAVRSFPFLGGKGNFELLNISGEKSITQMHLYSIIRALDVTCSTFSILPESFVDVNYNAVLDAAYAATMFNEDAQSEASTTAVFACYSASDYFRKVRLFSARYEFDYSMEYLGKKDISSLDSAIAAAISLEKAANFSNFTFEDILWNDLRCIQNGQTIKSNSTDIYGDVWKNFLIALAEVGCSYWGRLYKQIFDNGFVLDKTALERRLNVPKEIQEKGAAAVANYLIALEQQGASHLNEARVIILGEKGAGKTCLARRLINPQAPMTTEAESTAGVDTSIWKLAEENINVHIWDFAGHTVTHTVHQFFLSERCLYVLVYDGRTEGRNRLEYWLDLMKNYGNNSEAIILVNKRDQHTVDIPLNSLKEKYAIAGNVHIFSIGTDFEKLEDFRHTIADYIKNKPSWNQLEIPSNYFRVKETLETLFANKQTKNGAEHIGMDQFISIAAKNEVTDIQHLLESLHALGISLWYPELEGFNTLILNPEWISHGVYQIINWLEQAIRHALTLQDFITVFEQNAQRYPADKHPFIYQLMIQYKLAYETKEQNACLVIPHLLKEDRPDNLPDFPVGESLQILYKAEHPLPPNTISRFIVEHNQEIQKSGLSSTVWRYGVVLVDGKSSIAMVREEDRTISVAVKGIYKTEYLSTLRETLNTIFNGYQSENPKLLYRVEEYGQIPTKAAKQALWLTDDQILKQSMAKELFYDYNSGQRIDLQPTVINYNITANNLINGSGGQLIDHSVHSTFNFTHCNVDLQGNLKELAQKLSEHGHETDAKELENTAKALKDIKQMQDKEEIKETGTVNRLKRLVIDLGDDSSSIGKAVKGIKNGIGIAQDIAEGYNGIAQWLGMPTVPKVFLKDKK